MTLIIINSQWVKFFIVNLLFFTCLNFSFTTSAISKLGIF